MAVAGAVVGTAGVGASVGACVGCDVTTGARVGDTVATEAPGVTVTGEGPVPDGAGATDTHALAAIATMASAAAYRRGPMSFIASIHLLFRVIVARILA